jgi:putative toxin-antitoxin system antitoxin component (TIGR02293 family)
MATTSAFDAAGEITALAISVFGKEETAKEWLSERNLATDDKPPIGLLDTAEGVERVKNLLLRIEYGVLA